MQTNDLSIRFKVNITWPEREFRIDSQRVAYGDTSVAIQDIVAIKFGHFSPPRIARSDYFHFKDRNGKVLETAYNSFMYDALTRDLWTNQIILKIWEVYGNRRLQTIHQDLLAGKDLWFETCVATRGGLLFNQKKWFKKITHTIPWEHLTAKTGAFPCSVIFSDRRDADVNLEFRYGAEWEGQFFFQYYLDLYKNPSLMAELRQAQA